MIAWTIDRIKEASLDSGSFWWDKSTMKAFGTRIESEVYQGDGGICFITSEKPLHGRRQFSVRQFNPETCNIATVGGFCSMDHESAIDLAYEISNGEYGDEYRTG